MWFPLSSGSHVRMFPHAHCVMRGLPIWYVGRRQVVSGYPSDQGMASHPPNCNSCFPHNLLVRPIHRQEAAHRHIHRIANRQTDTPLGHYSNRTSFSLLRLSWVSCQTTSLPEQSFSAYRIASSLLSFAFFSSLLPVPLSHIGNKVTKKERAR